MKSLDENQFKKSMESYERGKNKIIFDAVLDYIDTRLEELKNNESSPGDLIDIMENLSNIGTSLSMLSQVENQESEILGFLENKQKLLDSFGDELVELEDKYKDEYKKFIKTEESIKKNDNLN